MIQRTTLCSFGYGFVLALPMFGTCAAASAPVVATVPIQAQFPVEEDPWEDIREMLERLCMVIPCPTPAPTQGGTASVLARIAGVIQSYNTSGVYPNLTVQERLGGLGAVTKIYAWISGHPGWIEAELEAQLITALKGIASDLDE